MNDALLALEGISIPRGFWAKVEPEPNSGCWLWTGATTYGGYGVVNSRILFHGLRRAHRVVYEAIFGPTSLHVLHRCDTPPCVNPRDLFAGTDADNVADMRAKGRRSYKTAAKGEQHGMARLSEAQVIEIRALRGVVRQCEIADRFSMSVCTIEAIHQRRLWKWLPAGKGGVTPTPALQVSR